MAFQWDPVNFQNHGSVVYLLPSPAPFPSPCFHLLLSPCALPLVERDPLLPEIQLLRLDHRRHVDLGMLRHCSIPVATRDGRGMRGAWWLMTTVQSLARHVGAFLSRICSRDLKRQICWVTKASRPRFHIATTMGI